MLKARGRGVVVRVIFDVRSKHFIPNPNPQTMKVFSVGGIAVKEAAPALFPITHQKTFIADKARALVMTFNLSPAYFGGTRDFGLITWNPDEVSEITKTFDADWAGRAAKHDSAALVWSPDNARSKITDLINSAGKTIEIYNLEVKDKGILSALAAAVKERKVTVRFIMAQLMTDGQNVNGAGAKILADAGILIKPMVNPFVHGKMVMADGGVVFIGSQNFSASSLDRNRELGVITANPLIVQQVRGVFDADWRTLK
jgi:phosphatidylserine/phosphatidylglycerophosphate/cardiolipin synthase-like enzyme